MESNWQHLNNALNKTYIFTDFKTAIDFMHSSVEAINLLNHHPEWRNVYNRVEVGLTTHDAGNLVTDKDYELAKLLDLLYANFCTNLRSGDINP